MKNYDLTKKEDHWQLIAEGGERATMTADTKAELLQKSIDFAKNSNSDISLKIHKENGQFQEERTYPRSSDPSKSKG